MPSQLSTRFVSGLTLSFALGCGAPPPAESPVPAAAEPGPAPAAAAPAAATGATPAAPSAPLVTPTPELVVVSVANPLNAARKETLALVLAELTKLAPNLDPKKTLVADAQGKPVLSQLVDSDGDETPDQLVFQAELDAGGN
ncbi:MAG TPA: DUF4861 family protein, partial [Polyangiaceae bacterium]